MNPTQLANDIAERLRQFPKTPPQAVIEKGLEPLQSELAQLRSEMDEAKAMLVQTGLDNLRLTETAQNAHRMKSDLEDECAQLRAKVTELEDQLATEAWEAGERIRERMRDESNLQSSLHAAQSQVRELRTALTKLVHYTKRARNGDSPLIHRETIEWVDEAIAKSESVLATVAKTGEGARS